MSETDILRRYRTLKQLAADLDVAELTLLRWRAAGTGPPMTKLGKRVLYSREGTEKWLRSLETATEAA
jgi:predicted site-specific integrase-resolvase